MQFNVCITSIKKINRKYKSENIKVDVDANTVKEAFKNIFNKVKEEYPGYRVYGFCPTNEEDREKFSDLL